MRTLRIFKQMAKISISASFAYRANFFLNLAISIFSNLLVPLVTVLIYQSGASIPGWTFFEALLVQASFMLSTGFCAPIFYGMVWVTMEHIREGSYDLLMIKPGNVIVLSIASAFEPENTGVLLGGIGMFVYSLLNLPAASAVDWLQFVFFFVSSVSLSLGLTLVMSATCFKWVGNSRIFEIYDSLTVFGRYPGTIFSKAITAITCFILPVAALGYLPAAALLHRSAPVMLFAFVPCIVFALLGVALFKFMIYKYQSAGG